MAMIRIRGGRPLHGEYTVPGSKNGALPILAASILCSQGPVTLLGCPHLSDVENMLALLRHLGCQTHWEGDALTIDAQNARVSQMPEELAKVMRSSIFMLGPLLGRFGSAVATYPGGCDIGLRPIDLHLKGLRTLGARITEQAGYIFSDGAALKGGMIHLDYPSVGATENLMMAAALIPGTTLLTNAAPVSYTHLINVILGEPSPPANDTAVQVPDVTGKTPEEANVILTTYGLQLLPRGNGVAVAQSHSPGTTVTIGTQIAVDFRE